MKYALFWILTLPLLVGCAPDITETDFFRDHPEEVDPETLLLELGNEVRDGFTFRLLAPEPLTSGYSTLWIEVLQNGQPITMGSVNVTAIWTNETSALVSPFAQSTASIMEEDNRFEASPFFLQPVGDPGAWEVHIDCDFAQETIVFPVEVDEALWVQHVHTGSEQTSADYYVSWLLPVRPTTGNDRIQFALHRLTGSGFEPLEDARIDLYPYMDMGAGEGHSTPFEAPVHTGAGQYTGEVNFIMSGGWDMTVYVERASSPRDTVVFKGFTVY